MGYHLVFSGNILEKREEVYLCFSVPEGRGMRNGNTQESRLQKWPNFREKQF